MWAEPEVTLAERLSSHYYATAEQFHAITLAGLFCAVCNPGEVMGEVRINPLSSVDWVKFQYPVVFLTHTPDEPCGYFAAMHELGHLATGRTKDGRAWARTGMREAEAEAWRWALKKAVIEPTPEAWRMIARMLRTYKAHLKPNPTFTCLLEEAERNAACV